MNEVSTSWQRLNGGVAATVDVSRVMAPRLELTDSEIVNQVKAGLDQARRGELISAVEVRRDLEQKMRYGL